MFNWWTFLFQTINFFVVLYILYRLFFNPLKNIIQKREESIKERLEKLRTGEKKLKEQEQDYQERLEEIGILKDKELSIARQEAQEEKDRLLEKAGKEIEEERLKQKNILQLEREKVDSGIKELSLQFSFDYLDRFARELIDEEMHQKLIGKFLHALKSTRANEMAALKKEMKTEEFDLIVYSPLKIKKETIHLISETLENIFDIKIVSMKTLTEESLIGGIKLGIQNTIIDGSIQGMFKQLKDEAAKEL